MTTIHSASFGNEDGTVVRAVYGDGSVWALPADHADLLGVSVAPYVAPVPSRVVPPLSFFDRFTAEQEDAIAQAAMTNPQVLLWLTKASGALEIDLDDQRTQEGLGLLVYLGLLTSDDVAGILA